MNDRNKGATSIDTLMKIGLSASTAIPVILIAILGIFARLIDPTAFVFVVGTCAMVVLLSVLTINYFVRRRIQDRVLGLVDVCRSYAGGDRAVRAAVIGEDEFAMLSMSLNTLLDSQGFIAGGAPSSAGSGGSEAAALQAQIEKLLQEVSAVGDGDLRVQAEVTPDTLGVLADSFNYMIEELAKVVGRVQATAVQVTTATRRLLDRSAEVSQASEAQSEQIVRTSEAVARLADFVQLSANNALQAADAARGAQQSAEAGQDAVVQTIDGMARIRDNVQETAKKIKRLGERSQEVGEIVRLIEDIADQTNLLALNAAIQSAMAGEHGRGFAVVAEEIRELAVRVTEATKKIANIVKAIQGDTYDAVVAMEDSTQQVVKGTQLADEAGNSLQNIYGAVENQAQMIQGIALAASERKQTAEAVAYAMNQIAEITRQTTIATQDAANNMSYLAELAEQLRGSVATFRLPDRISEEAGLQSTGYQPTATDTGLQEWVNGPQPLPALPPGPSAPIGAYSNMGDIGGMGGGMDGYPGYGEYAAGYDGYDGYNTGYGYPAAPGMTNGLAGQTGMGSGMGNGNGMGNGANYGAPGNGNGNGQRGGYPGWPDNNNDQFPPPDPMGGQSY